MSLALIREKLKSVLEGVPGTGVVHDYQRVITTEESFRAAFVKQGSGQMAGWTITRESTEEEAIVFATQSMVRHTMVMRGFMAVNDTQATERTFQDLVEAVCAALRVRPTLGGAGRSSEPPQVRAVEHREFGGVLSHYAEVVMRTDELVMFTEITT